MDPDNRPRLVWVLRWVIAVVLLGLFLNARYQWSMHKRSIEQSAAPELAATNVAIHSIPRELWGKWRVSRIIPTWTISCWSQEQAEAIIGSEVEYSQKLFRWKGFVTNYPNIETTVISGHQFEVENSGSGSHVTFSDLGIKTDNTTQVVIKHSPAEITEATTEVPGDTLLIKDKNTIVFSVCNVFFEAKRARTVKSNGRVFNDNDSFFYRN